MGQKTRVFCQTDVQEFHLCTPAIQWRHPLLKRQRSKAQKAKITQSSLKHPKVSIYVCVYQLTDARGQGWLLCMRDGGASFVGHTLLQGNLHKPTITEKKEVEIRLFLYSSSFLFGTNRRRCLMQYVGSKNNLTIKDKLKNIFLCNKHLAHLCQYFAKYLRHIVPLLC